MYGNPFRLLWEQFPGRSKSLDAATQTFALIQSVSALLNTESEIKRFETIFLKYATIVHLSMVLCISMNTNNIFLKSLIQTLMFTSMSIFILFCQFQLDNGILYLTYLILISCANFIRSMAKGVRTSKVSHQLLRLRLFWGNYYLVQSFGFAGLLRKYFIEKNWFWINFT